MGETTLVKGKIVPPQQCVKQGHQVEPGVHLCRDCSASAGGVWKGGRKKHGIVIYKDGRRYPFRTGIRKPGRPEGRWKA